MTILSAENNTSGTATAAVVDRSPLFTHVLEYCKVVGTFSSGDYTKIWKSSFRHTHGVEVIEGRFTTARITSGKFLLRPRE